jgi:hypothetical protein
MMFLAGVRRSAQPATAHFDALTWLSIVDALLFFRSHNMRPTTQHTVRGLILVSLAYAALIQQPVSAEWILLDDFESYTAGESIDGQSNGPGEWVSPADFDFFEVEVDPTNDANQVLSVLELDTGEKQAYLTDERIDVAEGSVGTWFVRFYRGAFETHINMGLSDEEDPFAWSSFESQFRDQLGFPAARDGGAFVNLDNDEVFDGLPEEEWIHLWVVSNNDDDTNQYYLQTESSIPTQIRLESGGNDEFFFRNGTTDPLTTFMVRANNEGNGTNIHIGPWYLDDLYLDPAGPNLTLPTEGGGLEGDFNNNKTLDAGDLDLLSQGQKDNDLAFDLNGDGATNLDDRKYWINDLKKSWMGDSNLDSEFNSGDLVVVFTAGLYETTRMAGWAEGDWNGDMQFDSSDLVVAFEAGGFELGPPAAVVAVPEPTSILSVIIALSGMVVMNRSSRRRSQAALAER